MDSTYRFIDTLKEFYSARQLMPVIIKSFEDGEVVNNLIGILSRADEHGLNPDDYHAELIINEFLNAVNDTIENPNRHEQLAMAEILLSKAIIKYAYHLRYGYVNPRMLFSDSYFIPLPDSSSRDLFEPLRQENIPDYLNKIQPAGAKYVKLQSALKLYKNYLGLDWPVITISSAKLEEGSTDPSLKLIASRLITLGLLDTSVYKLTDSLFYDSTLVDAVKKFQKINGLNEDGVIGSGTLERLNITPEQYVKTIKINLERFRWIDYTNTPQYLLVNIPDFKVFAVENGKKLFDIKVCTGIRRPANFQARNEIYKKTKKIRDKPDDWETPVLYSELAYMVLNPTWTVPASIIREEILREVTKDSNYLQIKNFKVFKDGVEIDLSEVDTKEFSSTRIPYTIVQDPGAGNALGKIKFMFNNPFGVYLHDTPTRAPFSKSNRAVSHGCVRVEKPIMLAEYLLRGHSKWNVDFLKLEIGQRVDDRAVQAEYQRKRTALRRNASFGKTTDIILDRKIPLYIDYYTAWVDDEGYVHFREDVYRKDKVLIEYMFPEKELIAAR
ncbi:MAG TPA: L,D-transpeptidase family protein [Ignavibacteriaceae bacterium]|nr:L,D-transpeptidase family protein [Ignavibacteriaceae bacterium]